MDFSQYEIAFRAKAKISSFSEENIKLCLDYAKPLIAKDFPVIYNTTNLSALFGYSVTYLKRAALYTNHFYRSFSVKKKNNKLRFLKEPLPSLKEIQIWILQNILYKIEVSKHAKAYVQKRNILENVKYHKGREKVLTLDVEDFFGSIKIISVEKIFRQIGYSSSISNLLSKLCTCDGCLPQGAPTSPYLSNIYLINFDKSISDFCEKRNIRFTRYADDLAFSGRFDEIEVIDFVTKEVGKIGLKLNVDKTRLMGTNVRQIVTGVVVNRVLQIPKFQRNDIRKEVHYILKFGLEDHLKRIKNHKANYVKHLLGKINYALYLNSKDEEMLGYKTVIKNLL